MHADGYQTAAAAAADEIFSSPWLAGHTVCIHCGIDGNVSAVGRSVAVFNPLTDKDVIEHMQLLHDAGLAHASC